MQLRELQPQPQLRSGGHDTRSLQQTCQAGQQAQQRKHESSCDQTRIPVRISTRWPTDGTHLAAKDSIVEYDVGNDDNCQCENEQYIVCYVLYFVQLRIAQADYSHYL